MMSPTATPAGRINRILDQSINRLAQQPLLFVFLFIAVTTLVVLLPGVYELTGISGKDEYFLSLRTPLTMMEMDTWWVPWLDEAPRLKKPPMLYWLARASMEIFGANVFAARLVAVLLSVLLIVSIAGIAKELFGQRRDAVLAAMVALSTLSLAIEGRRLMLDLPAAAFSTFSLYLLICWWQTPRFLFLTGSAMALAAAVLTKGPLGLTVFGSGFLALWIMRSEFRQVALDHKLHVLVFLVIWTGLSAPWFVYVAQHFPEHASSMMQEDVESRQLMTLSPAPISALLLIAFPWSFLILPLLFRIKTVWRQQEGAQQWLAVLLLWLFINLLPFFFFRSFTRYMAGIIVPLSLLVVLIPQMSAINLTWWRRAVIVPVILLSGFILFLAGWFNPAGLAVLLGLVALVYFIVTWWRQRPLTEMAMSAMLLWLVVIGFVYPRIGINALPQEALTQVGNNPVVLFGGPQPALLPIAKGRAYVRTKILEAHHIKDKPYIYARAESLPQLKASLQKLQAGYHEVYEFRTLSSRGTWLNFSRKGVTAEDWRQALRRRDLDPVKSTIVLLAPVTAKDPDKPSVD